MEMLRVHAGKLRAMGYDNKLRLLRIEIEDGRTLEYTNISEKVWHDFKTASSPWSFYRDHVEEEFSSRNMSRKPGAGGQNPLDDLFK